MKTRIVVSMDDDVLNAMRDIAKKESEISCEFVSVSSLIRSALRKEYINNSRQTTNQEVYDSSID